MKTKHTFSVDFVIRKCKTEKTKALIYARITVDGGLPKELSLKEQINVSDWDYARGEMKGKGIAAQAINNAMQMAHFKIKEKYREMLEKNCLITADLLKQEYLGVNSKLKSRQLNQLLDYYHDIWKDKLKHGGFKNIETTIGYLKAFSATQNSEGIVYLSQIDMEWLTDFEHYVRNNPIKGTKPCLGNGLGKHIQRFKTILNWAVKIKWMQLNPVEKYSCPLKRNKRKKLTIQEVFLLENKTFTDPTLALVKDMFLYSCYTGLAFVDAKVLKPSDFEWDTDGIAWCKIYRTKTDGLCSVPLLKTPTAILEKYKLNPAAAICGRVFPRISHQHVNRSLAIIREACEIVTPMTFHVARHTFAKTVALKNGVPMETVQMMLGHTKITTTQIYAEVDEEKIAEDMSGVEERIKLRREKIYGRRDDEFLTAIA